MKTFFLFLCIALTTAYSSAQNINIIYFKEHTKGIQLENYASLFSPKSISRRERQHVKFDELDNPVNKEIIKLLSTEGDILSVSRWLNALTLKSNINSKILIEKYDFIEKINVIKPSKTISKIKFELNTKSLNYGGAENQIKQLNLDCLHDLGYTGEGIYLGIIDAGFKGMDTISYFSSVYTENRILDTYNFVNDNTDIYDYSNHGTLVSSCIIGEKPTPNEYIGTAVDVDLALYVTEDLNSETEIEEFNLVAALERADMEGIDVVNISLGYFNFDDPETSHLFDDLDGITTIASIGVNTALTKGIIVVTSAGNSGPSNISTPCDARGALCAGAVDASGTIASFSSVGPSADNRIKPDVVAQGQSAWLIDESGNLTQANGTSFSSPILAGATACLIQANPNKSAQQVMDAIRESSSQYNSPDQFIGYGIPDFCLANTILNSSASIPENNKSAFELYPNPAKTFATINIESNTIKSLKLVNELGQIVSSNFQTGLEKTTTIGLKDISAGLYILQIKLIDETYINKKLLIQE